MPGTIHATAVLVGARAVLIRGPSGSGKSMLAFRLMNAGLPFTRLVGDDRIAAEPAGGRLLVRPAPALDGLIEIRGLGIRRLPCEPVAVVGLVVDLAASDAARMPCEAGRSTTISGVHLPRLAVPEGADGLPALVAAMHTAPMPDLTGH